MNLPTGILPAIRSMKDFDKAINTDHDTVVLLETRLSQLKNLVAYVHRHKKKIIIHFDLIHGLKTDEYAMEYVVHEVKPDGIISTKGNIIGLAKKHNIMAIQRMFLLDSIAIKHNQALIGKVKPDCIEVLPGLLPTYIQHLVNETNVPVIAGGLITNQDEAQLALEAGAIAVSTSETSLW